MCAALAPHYSLFGGKYKCQVSPAIALGSVKYSNRVKKLSREHLLALAESTQLAAEKLSAIRMVRAFGAEGLEKGRYYKKVEQSFKIGKSLAIV